MDIFQYLLKIIHKLNFSNTIRPRLNKTFKKSSCRLYKVKALREHLRLPSGKRFYIKRMEIIRSKTVNSKLSHKSPHYTPYTLCMRTNIVY